MKFRFLGAFFVFFWLQEPGFCGILPADLVWFISLGIVGWFPRQVVGVTEEGDFKRVLPNSGESPFCSDGWRCLPKIFSHRKEKVMKKKLFFVLLAIMMSLLLCYPAVAANRAGAGSVTPFIGGYNFDGDEHLDKAILYGFRMGYNFTKHWTLEGVLTYAEADGRRHCKQWGHIGSGGYDGTHEGGLINNMGCVKSDSGDAKMVGYKMEVLYNFLPDGMIVPFVAAGVGGRHMNWDDRSNDNDFVVDYGAGVKIFFAEDWAVRGDIRHIYVTDENVNNVEYGIGISYFFGGKKEQAPPPPPPPKPEPAPFVEPDSDGDGVIDRLDQCPDTPAGVIVDEVGCPIDTDRDGVPDYLDKCPDTPIELKVDKDGCPIRVTINLNVLFDFDKSDVKPKYHSEIKRVADYMNAYPWEKATLEGHTDSRGTDAYNQKLSQRRVDAIKNYLVDKFGIGADRLTAVGYGESRPIATNDTDEGRQLNRRVQAVMETYIRR